MRASPNFLKAIDEWRRKQPDLPSRNEAIMRLVEQSLLPSALALEAEAKKKGKRP